MAKNYGSDISREQFEIIREDLEKAKKATWPRIVVLYDNFGYSGENFASEVHRIIGSKVEIVKKNDAHKFSVIPKRWVVERTFAWFEKFHRLWKNCERLLLSSLSFLLLSLIFILIKRF